jgi:hypothetical protein
LPYLGLRAHFVAQALAHGFSCVELKIRGGESVRGQLRGKFEREQPGLVVRFQRDGVAVGRTVGDRRVGEFGGDRFVARAPGAAVEARQNRTAPVHLALLRHRAGEFRAEGDGVGLDQVVDGAGRHVVRQPGEAAVGVGRQSPERAGNAREEDEEDQHEGQRLRQHQPGQADERNRTGLGIDEAGECGGGDGQGADHGECDGDRLVLEELREREEVGEQDDGESVARGA